VRAATPDAIEAQVKAGCLFNFVRFANWPADILAPGAPVGICSLGPSDVEVTLESTFKNRKIDNHPVVFRQIRGADDSAGCHVLFLSGPPSPVMKTLRKSPRAGVLLIVGDDDTYSRFGTLIDFTFEGGRVAFIANTDAITRSRVRISSSLLSLTKLR
jgi:hypothetical protein